MNTRILLLAISVVALSSCSVYRSGQTPDDVYYSPAPARQQARANNNNNDDSYVNVNQHKDGTNNNYQSYDQYQDSYRDDRFLRMSVGNPYYMNAYNSYGAFDWRYNSFYDGFNYGFSSPWNNYFAWNSFYNPYYGSALGYYGYGLGGGYYAGGGGVKTSAYTMPSRPVVFNVNSYSNNSNRPVSRNYSTGNYNNSNQRYNNTNGNNGRTNNTYYNNSNNNGRSTYTPANSNSNNNSYTPSRSYTPSSSGGGGGSSSGGGGGGGGSVSRPGRGN